MYVSLVRLGTLCKLKHLPAPLSLALEWQAPPPVTADMLSVKSGVRLNRSLPRFNW